MAAQPPPVEAAALEVDDSFAVAAVDDELAGLVEVLEGRPSDT